MPFLQHHFQSSNALGEPQQRRMQRRGQSCGKVTGLDFCLCGLFQSAESTTSKKGPNFVITHFHWF